MTDLRALITELVDELDHNRQCLMDDRRLTHPLADKARTALAEPQPPANGDVAELVAWLRLQGEAQKPSSNSVLSESTKNELYGFYLKLTRAADLLERLSPPQTELEGAND